MKWALVALLVVGLGIGAYFLVRKRDPSKPRPTPGPTVAEGSATNPDDPNASAAPGRPANPDKAQVKAAHQLLIQQIERARQRRLAELARDAKRPSNAPAPAVPSLVDNPPSPLDTPLAKDYIRERMMDIRPLIQECYETSMATHPEQAAGGTITLSFRMAGEPGVGGVILDNKIIEEKSTFAGAPYLAECVTESIYAMRFDPPAAGGFIDVTYPFIFQTTDETDETDDDPDGG